MSESGSSMTPTSPGTSWGRFLATSALVRREPIVERMRSEWQSPRRRLGYF